MKKLLLFLMLCFPLIVNAQEKGDNIIYKEISKKMNLKDKVIVTNKSPYFILQLAVAAVFDGQLLQIGTINFLRPNESVDLVSLRNNGLRKIRGKKIAIKAKGTKIFLGEGKMDPDPDVVNNIKDKDITYDFDAVLYEDRHDLHIEMVSSKKDIMDF